MCQGSKLCSDQDRNHDVDTNGFIPRLKLLPDGRKFPSRTWQLSVEGSRVRTSTMSTSIMIADAGDQEQELAELPEVLVEKIVAGIPFPHVLKARQLSKEWKSKFSKVVSQASVKWPEYFPAFLSKQKSRVEGYDAVRSCETHMEGVYAEAGDWDVRVTGYGTLLVVFNLNYRLGQPVATVINLVTRQSKDILWPIRPPVRSDRFYSFSWPILVFLGSDNYELVSWFWEVEKPSFQRKSTNFLVYNSSSGSWIEKSYPNDCIKDCYYGAYLDGSVFYIYKPQGERSLPRIVRFNVKSGARTESAPIEPDDILDGDWVHCAVVRCDRRVMAVMFEHNGYSFKVKILQLNTDSFELVKLSESSLSTKSLPISFYDIPVVASSDCIYVLQLYKPILTTYYVNSNTWSSNISIPEKFCKLEVRRNLFVFEPGLNPFVAP